MDHDDASDQGGSLMDKAKEAFSNFTGGGDSSDDLEVENRATVGENYVGAGQSAYDTTTGADRGSGTGSMYGSGSGTTFDAGTATGFGSEAGTERGFGTDTGTGMGSGIDTGSGTTFGSETGTGPGYGSDVSYGSDSGTSTGYGMNEGYGTDTGAGVGTTGIDQTRVNNYASDMGGGNMSNDPASGYSANADVRSAYDPQTDRPGSYDDPGFGDESSSNDPLT